LANDVQGEKRILTYLANCVQMITAANQSDKPAVLPEIQRLLKACMAGWRACLWLFALRTCRGKLRLRVVVKALGLRAEFSTAHVLWPTLIQTTVIL
jgi:hypothetical protein